MSEHREKHRKRLLAKIRKGKRDIAELIQDIESWNDNNPRGDYIEPDGDGSLARTNAHYDRMLKEIGETP